MPHRRLFVFAIVALLAFPEQAAASNLGSNTASGGTAAHACDHSLSSQCIANDGHHTVADFGLDNGWDTAVDHAVSLWNGDATVSVAWLNGNPSGDDVWATNGTFGINGAWAWTQCTASTLVTYGGTDPRRWCRPQELLPNDSYSQTGPQKNVITCHEMGHTLGLRHSNEASGSCMKKDQRTIGTISAHDHAMLAALY